MEKGKVNRKEIDLGHISRYHQIELKRLSNSLDIGNMKEGGLRLISFQDWVTYE